MEVTVWAVNVNIRSHKWMATGQQVSRPLSVAGHLVERLPQGTSLAYTPVIVLQYMSTSAGGRAREDGLGGKSGGRGNFIFI